MLITVSLSLKVGDALPEVTLHEGTPGNHVKVRKCMSQPTAVQAAFKAESLA
jgi:hypothetical protein